MGEQFSERDNAFIENAMDSVNVPYGEPMIIKRWTGISDPGDPGRGIQPTYSYTNLLVTAVVNSVDQTDILYSGGLYQVGDLRVSLVKQLNAPDTINQVGGKSDGDRIAYRGHEYRVVGKVKNETLVNNNVVYTYVMRKVGNS